MSSLIGGQTGNQSRLASGIVAGQARFAGEVLDTALQPGRATLGPRVGWWRRVIRGVSRDAADAPLAACVVKLFRSADDVKTDQVTSDGGGNYEFSVYDDQTYFLVEYKAGAPDRAGTSVNTLVGV